MFDALKIENIFKIFNSNIFIMNHSYMCKHCGEKSVNLNKHLTQCKEKEKKEKKENDITLYIGNCLDKLKLVNNKSITTIYLDPPFDSDRVYKLSEESDVGFNDKWETGAYEDFIKNIIDICYLKLINNGTLFFHISSECMFIPEKVLRNKFKYVSPIFWKKCRSKNNVKHKLGSTIDIIFKCSKIQKPKFNIVYQAKDEKYLANSFNNEDDKGKYSLGHLVTEPTKKGHMYSFNFNDIEHNPTSGWRIKKEALIKLKDENRLHISKKKDSKLYKKIYLHENPGKLCTDLWDDIHSIGQGSEKRKYPTAKPIKLLERIIEISSDVGDIILDPMCGSGTTGIAAKNLHRKCILIDINKDTKKIIDERLAS
jgi:DNA modification methylase